jgi:hypothetical protein
MRVAPLSNRCGEDTYISSLFITIGECFDFINGEAIEKSKYFSTNLAI